MSNVATLELRVRWGDRLLHVAHVSPKRDIWVGDDAEGPVVYVLPIARRRITPGVTDLDAFIVEAELCSVERVPQRRRPPSELSAAVVLSVLLHAMLFAGFAMQPPASLDLDAAEPGVGRKVVAKSLAKSEDEKDSRSRNVMIPPSASGNDLGAAHHGAGGTLGRSDARDRSAHFAVKGPPETRELRLARDRARIESNSYGALGALAAVLGHAKGGTFAGDDDDDLGTDARTVNGRFFAPRAGEAHGTGLGLAGSGSGGSSEFSGIGIGEVGIFGGCGCGIGFGAGSGFATGRLGLSEFGKHKTGTVKIPDGGDEIRGELPPAIIKRMVHANFPRFRACYESGLKRDPTLAGTVSVRFIIDSTGAVETAAASGGTLTDAAVRACVTSVYRTLSFPEPTAGKVLVQYPIDFQPE